MKSNQKLIKTILTAVALGLSVASIVAGNFGELDLSSQISMLSIGLVAMAMAAMQKIE